MITTGEDLRFPQAVGPRPWSLSVIQSYLAQVFEVAHHNPTVAKRFFQVMTFLRTPPTLFQPDVAWPVVRHMAAKLLRKVPLRRQRKAGRPLWES